MRERKKERERKRERDREEISLDQRTHQLGHFTPKHEHNISFLLLHIFIYI